jgi:hypothetical protein
VRASVLLVLIAGLAGCGRSPAPATDPVALENRSGDRGPPAGYRGPVASYLREARSAAYVLDRSPPPPLLTAEDMARRVSEMYGRLPAAPADWDRKADMDVLLKRINEEVSLGAGWVARAEKAEETEVGKYRESLKEAVRAINDRADQAEALLGLKK